MKRVTSILAVFALSSAAYAADTVDMKWNAEMRTRYTSDNAYSGTKGDKEHTQNTYNGFGQRNKLGLHLTKGENFQGQVSLINHFYWGSTNTRTASGYNSGAANTITGTEDNNLLLVNEAYGWWKANDMLAVKFGRSAFEVANGFVSSADDWRATPFSYDGIWTMWDFEPVNLNVFGLKAVDRNVNHAQTGTVHNGQSDPENVSYGAVVGFKTLPDVLKKAEIHLMQTNDETYDVAGALLNTPVNSVRSEILRYGFYVGGDTMGLDYRGVYDMYQGKAKYSSAGTNTDYDVSGNMLDLGVGYTMPEMMMFRIGAVYHMDSGAEAGNATNKAFKSYKPGQYDAHNLGGTYLDAVTWGNLTYYSIEAGVKPQEDITANLRWTKFSRTNDKDTVAVYGNAAGNTGAGDKSNDIGSEIDVTLTKSYGDNFSMWALYGVFTPGDLVKKDGVNGTVGSTEEENHTRIQLQGKLTF